MRASINMAGCTFWPRANLHRYEWQRTPWWLFWKKPWRRRTSYYSYALEADLGMFVKLPWEYCTHADLLLK